MLPVYIADSYRRAAQVSRDVFLAYLPARLIRAGNIRLVSSMARRLLPISFCIVMELRTFSYHCTPSSATTLRSAIQLIFFFAAAIGRHFLLQIRRANFTGGSRYIHVQRTPMSPSNVFPL